MPQNQTEPDFFWEPHQNAVCYLEKIMETITHKTAAVQPAASHFTSHSRKTNKTCRHCCKSKRSLISNILCKTPVHRHASVGQLVKYLVKSALYGHKMQPRGPARSNG